MGDFKNVFKNLRLKYNYTQDGLAEALGISRSAVSMYENGNREPDFETLEKIADLFNVDMDYLIGRKNIPNDYQAKMIHKEYEPTYKEMHQLIARNGKKLSTEEKMELIKLLSELK